MLAYPRGTNTGLPAFTDNFPFRPDNKNESDIAINAPLLRLHSLWTSISPDLLGSIQERVLHIFVSCGNPLVCIVGSWDTCRYCGQLEFPTHHCLLTGATLPSTIDVSEHCETIAPPVIRKSIVCGALLVATKRDGGIHARHKASRNIAGKQRNACKQERNRTHGNALLVN